MAAKGIETANALSSYINKNAKSGGLDRSYVAQIVKKDGAGVNITLDKLNILAEGLNVQAWQLVHPLGFNCDGISLSINNEVDLTTMTKAISYANTVCVEAKQNSEEFRAKATAIAYASLLNDSVDLNIELIKLVSETK